MNIARAYDAAAPEYDAALAQDPVAVWMRQQLWAHYVRVIAPTARVLDFTAGTGADAIFLARRGAQVLACDVSPGMLQELQRRARAEQVQVETRVLAAEMLDLLDGSRFDAAVSGFAGINTIEEPPQLAHNLARLVKPRGRVILHALNANCIWEKANQIAHGQLPRTRTAGTRIGGEQVALHFFNPHELFPSAFAAQFTLRELYGLSLVTAPTWMKRAGLLAPALFRADRIVGRVLPAAGDFFVMDLERRAT